VKIQGPDKIILARSKKEKQLRIFCDIDGVCSDFDKSACEICDIDLEDKEVREHLKKGGRIEKYISDEEMWDRINDAGEDFWADMELLPWAKDLYNALEKEAGNLLAFLTSPSDNPVCAAGKVKWIKKHFDTKNFIITPRKHFCAGPNSILVDDTQKKVDQFIKHGGKAFLWPSPLAFEDGDKEVEKVIKDLLECIDEMA